MESLVYIKRKTVNNTMLVLSYISALLGFIILLLILIYTIIKGANAINLDFFIKLPKPTGEAGGGIANAIIGTFIVVGIASIIAVPIGIMSGIYLSEFGKNRFAGFVRYMTDIMNGIPSIIAGIAVYVFIVVPMHEFSALSGGIALSILMIPVITRTSEELIKMVPDTIKEAALALGIPKWKVIIFIVLRTASVGIITGIMLAVARVGGETAPLLFTAFNNPFMSFRLDQPIATMTVLIYNYASSPYLDWNRIAWGSAFVLIMGVLIVNILAKMFTKKSYSL
ncbi:MAG: phosphate ABC transporter permease PstA [Deltaproteobacteria bacterium]|nr:phosphate ABC transporter permease PstA [Deltaproteobacteria bacterium]MCL5791709.1 phosphate ABC transporter permease PstA [Deltaproteobacteria bacterium]